MRETWVQSLDWKDPLEREMATHSIILAWEVTWAEEPAVYSPWGRKEPDMTEATEHAKLFNNYLLFLDGKHRDKGRETSYLPEFHEVKKIASFLVNINENE